MIKPIALFDIDNTIYEGFSYFELLEKQVDEGLIDKQVFDNAKSSMQKYKSKLQDYETTIVELLDIYAAGLREKVRCGFGVDKTVLSKLKEVLFLR